MRFKNVKHAEYEILKHLRTKSTYPLSDVMENGIPGYYECDGITHRTDKLALKRFKEACEKIDGVLLNMISKRVKYVPEEEQ
jgi:hypothetical protein